MYILAIENGRCKMKKNKGIILVLLIANFSVISYGCTTQSFKESTAVNENNKETSNKKIVSNKVLVKDLSQKEEEKLNVLLGKSKENNNYAYELVSKRDGKETRAKLWRKGNNYRLDIDENNDISIYIDNNKNEAFMYQRSYNIITNLNSSGKINIKDYEATLDNLDLYNYVKKSNQVIDNKNCAVFEISLGEEKEHIYVWQEYGIIIKVAVYKDEKQQSELLFKDYTVEKVTDEMVNLPRQATYVDWKP